MYFKNNYFSFRRKKPLDSDYYGTRTEMPYGLSLEMLENLYKEIQSIGLEEYSPLIDAQTWNDLELSDCFKLINYAQSAPGFYYLYRSLKKPELESASVILKNRAAEFFHHNSSIRNSLSKIFSSMREHKFLDILRLIKTINLPVFYYRLCIILRVLSVISILSILLIPSGRGLLAVICMFVVNMFVYGRIARFTEGTVPALGALMIFIRNSKTILKLLQKNNFPENTGINKIADEISSVLKVLEPLQKSSKFLGQSFSSPENISASLWMYLDIFFHLSAVSFYKSLDSISENRDSVYKLYLLCGRIDFLISLASARKGFEQAGLAICTPVLKDQSRNINAENLYMPVIPEAVGNSILIEKPGILLTGANMAGKSTFLRTVGLNAVCAQSLGFCFADSWESGLFIVKSSIDKKDSTQDGESLYFAEAQRIGEILNTASESKTAVLCLFDELLSGTNTEEREAAVAAILRGICSMNALTVSATHDLSIVEEFKSIMSLKYFTYRIEDGGLHFDYKIRDGRAGNGNAVSLLRYLGYPENIVSDAESRLF